MCKLQNIYIHKLDVRRRGQNLALKGAEHNIVLKGALAANLFQVSVSLTELQSNYCMWHRLGLQHGATEFGA